MEPRCYIALPMQAVDLRVELAAGAEAVEARTELPAPSLREVIDTHHAFVWRSLRRLGVQERNVDDATQAVFLIVAKHVEGVAASKMRSFVFGVAMRVAANTRRSEALRTKRECEIPEDIPDAARTPERMLETRHARRLLDEILEALPEDLRVVFVLTELEQMTAPDIATLLDIPVGTATSRLRRARESVQVEVRRIRAREAFQGKGTP